MSVPNAILYRMHDPELGLGSNPQCPSIADAIQVLEMFLDWVDVDIDGNVSNHGTYKDLQKVRDAAVRVITVGM